MAKDKTKKESKKISLIATGAVVYTDGSAMPNPGPAGWGIHGYTYDNTNPKPPPASQKKNLITDKGYLNRDDMEEGISYCQLVQKINGYGVSPYPNPTNNNLMELHALERTFDLALENPTWTRLEIHSDSKYAIGAVDIWYQKWVGNGWRNSKGEPIKEKEIIQSIHDKYELVKEKMSVNIQHIKAHAGHYGNELVDKLAKRGAILNRYGKTFSEIKMTDKGTPSVKVEYHPFFTKNRWYFQSGNHPTPYVDGYYMYRVGVMGQGKKDPDFGVHQADGFMALNLLKEPEPLIERIQSIYNKLCPSDYEYIISGRLDTVLTPASFEDLVSEHSEQLICHDKIDKTLILPSGQVVCSTYNPVLLSYLQMERYEVLMDLALDFIHGSDQVLIQDLTDKFIEKTTDKKGKVTCTLNPMIKSMNGLKVTLEGVDPATGEVQAGEVHLTTKVDLPDRIHLAKLVKVYNEKLKIAAITRRYGENIYRVATVVYLEDKTAIGLWTNLDSSFLYIKPTKTVPKG